jgi:hypothetical protein
MSKISVILSFSGIPHMFGDKEDGGVDGTDVGTSLWVKVGGLLLAIVGLGVNMSDGPSLG